MPALRNIEKRARVKELRLQGLSYNQISRILTSEFSQTMSAQAVADMYSNIVLSEEKERKESPNA